MEAYLVGYKKRKVEEEVIPEEIPEYTRSKVPEAYFMKNTEGKLIGVIRNVPDLDDNIYMSNGRGKNNRVTFEDIDEFKRVCIEYDVKNRSNDAVFKLLTSKPEDMTILPVDLSGLPPKMIKMLRGYQLTCIREIIEKHNGNALMNAPPGHGKTPMASIIAWHYGGKILVVCTKNMTAATMDNGWKKQIKRWTGLDSKLIVGRKTEIEFSEEKETEVFIVGYDTAKANNSILKKKWDVIIFDESTELKNPESDRTKALLPLARSAKHTLFLSGTPITNSAADVYTQASVFLDKNIFGSWEDYRIRYCSAKMRKYFNTTKLKDGMSRYMDELFMILSRCMVVVEKQDITDGKERKPIDVQLSDKQLLKHGEIRDEKDNTKEFREQERLAMKWWRMTGKHKAKPIAKWVLKWRVKNPGKKFVIFAHHKKVMKRIKKYLKGVKAEIVNKDTSLSERARITDALASKTDMSVEVGILSFKTCAFGITLSPGVKDCGIAEIPMVPAMAEQAEDKVNRFGQKGITSSYWFIADGTYDERLMNAAQNKTNVTSRLSFGKKRKLEFDKSEPKENEPKKKHKTKHEKEVEERATRGITTMDMLFSKN